MTKFRRVTPNFWDPYLCPYIWTYMNQIWHHSPCFKNDLPVYSAQLWFIIVLILALKPVFSLFTLKLLNFGLNEAVLDIAFFAWTILYNEPLPKEGKLMNTKDSWRLIFLTEPNVHFHSSLQQATLNPVSMRNLRRVRYDNSQGNSNKIHLHH